MSNGRVVASRPFELSWRIRVHDMAVDMGKIRFDNVVDPTSFVGDESEDSEVDCIQVVECSSSWKEFALPIFINEMVLADYPESKLQNVPAYEEASFVVDVGHADLFWQMKGLGFGNFYLRTIGGTPHLDNECVGKQTIKEIFELITLP